MKKNLSVIMALIMCLSLISVPAGAFAEGSDPAAALSDEAPAVTAVSAAFQQKIFTDLNKAGKLTASEGMELSEDPDMNGLVLKGKAGDIAAGRITIAEDFDFSEKPESRKSDIGPVGRITADGLSDKKATVHMNVYLDDETEPAVSMLLRKQMGKAGWSRKGEKTFDVLDKKITGKHLVSIGFDIEGVDASKKTTVLLRNIMFCENSLPVMYFDIDESEGSIDAMNSSDDHSAECYGSVTLEVPDGYKGEFSDKELKTTGPMDLEYMRGRGNSTWGMDKKPYKVKFDKKQNLLGMGANKHWVLLANRYDSTLLRNRITYWIVREMGMEFAIKCAPVEVVMNGEYYGSYLLSQQVRVGDTRVEIDELDETVKDPESLEITGGYLLNMEGGYDDDLATIITPSHYYYLESPDFEDYPNTEEAKAAKAAQHKYINDYMLLVEKMLLKNNLKDDEGNSYEKYLDKQAAVDFWWIQEFTINGDAYINGSSYLYKKRNTVGDDGKVTIGKLYWGPLWDFDYVAWGNPLAQPDMYEGFDNTSHAWMNALRTDDDFVSTLKARWSAEQDAAGQYGAHLNDLITEVTKEGGVIDRYYEEARVSEYYDYVKYGFYEEGGGYYDYYGHYGKEQADESSTEEGEPGQTYESTIEQLKNWIGIRQNWVNNNLDEVKASTFTVNFIADGKIVETRSYLMQEEYGELPAAPEKEGFVFTGWYDQSGYQVMESDCVYENTDVTAAYVKKSDIKQAKDILFRNYDVYTWFDNSEDDENYYTPDYEILPENALYSNVEWSVSDPETAVVNENGDVHAKKTGSVTVTARLSSGKTRSYNITFMGDDDIYDVEEITLNKNRLTVNTGSYGVLRYDMNPKPHYTGNVSWFSLDPDVAAVDEYGAVTGRTPGKTRIMALDLDSLNYAICTVTVKPTAKYAKAAKVTGVKAKAVKKGSKRKVKVSWKKNPDVTGCYVLRGSKKNGSYKKVGTVKKTDTVTWTDKKVKKGKKYFYKVQPYTKISGKIYKGKKSAAASVKVR